MYTVQIPNNSSMTEWTTVTKYDGKLCQYKALTNARKLAQQMINLLSHHGARIVGPNGIVEVITPEMSEAIQEVTEKQAQKVKAGIFIATHSDNRQHVSVFLYDRTTYVNGPFKSAEDALTDARRVNRMYTRLRIYMVKG